MADEMLISLANQNTLLEVKEAVEGLKRDIGDIGGSIDAGQAVYEQTLIERYSSDAVDWVFRVCDKLGLALCNTCYIDSDELRKCSTFAEVINNTEMITILANSEKGMKVLAASETAMRIILSSEELLQMITNSQTAMEAVTSSPTAMQLLCSSPLAVYTVVKNQTARTIFGGSPFIHDNYSRLNTTVNNTTYFTAKGNAASPTAAYTAYYSRSDGDWIAGALAPAQSIGFVYTLYNSTTLTSTNSGNLRSLDNRSVNIHTWTYDSGMPATIAVNYVATGGMYARGRVNSYLFVAKDQPEE